MQAILTKYISPTDTKSGRIKAWCDAGSITIPYPHEASGGIEGAHTVAAHALIKKLGWDSPHYGNPICGGLPQKFPGAAFVFVFPPKWNSHA